MGQLKYRNAAASSAAYWDMHTYVGTVCVQSMYF